jgi:hypothetical protein
MSRVCLRFAAAAIVGFLGTALLSPLLSTPVSRISTAHAGCAVGEYRDYYQDTLSNPNETWNNQIHYRINSDCTWKAYQTIFSPAGSSYSVWGAQLWAGSNSGGSEWMFDWDTGSEQCTTGAAQTTYHQYSVALGGVSGLYSADGYGAANCQGGATTYVGYRPFYQF